MWHALGWRACLSFFLIRRSVGDNEVGRAECTAADKAASLAAFATSGQTIKVFCAETGVPRATFNLWQAEARRAQAARPPSAPTFARVELPVAGPPPGITMVVRRVNRHPKFEMSSDTPRPGPRGRTHRARCGDGRDGPAGRPPRAARVIGLASGRPIFLATGVTDLRRGVTSLYALILEQLHQEPFSGAIFGFCNRRRDTEKRFCYDTGGIWICATRLEQGTFRWPAVGSTRCN